MVAIYVISIQFLVPALRDDAKTYHTACKNLLLLITVQEFLITGSFWMIKLNDSVRDIKDQDMLNFNTRDGFRFSREIK